MKFKTSIPELPPDGTPNAGARKVAGKSNAPDANVSPSLHPTVESVKDAECVKGAAAKAIKIQVDGDGIANSNPKKRARNYWGREEE